MLSALRDFLLSFCPAAFRRTHRPESQMRTLRAATWSGLAQFFLGSISLVLRFKTYSVLRTHQLAPHVGGASEVIDAGMFFFILFEYLLYPFSLFLLYLAIEGLVRFVAGVTTGELVPNFIFFLGFKTVERAGRRKERRQIANLPPDTLESLPDGRLRIAAARPKPGWNASITIGVDGQWFEIERLEQGPEPRSFVYLLRPAHSGKILRGYQEYDVASAVAAGPLPPVHGQASASPKTFEK